MISYSQVASSDWRSAVPRPGMSATESVVIQLRALQDNNPANDDGIRKTFEFGSQRNQDFTGPLPRFAEMIRIGYAPLLNSTDFSILSADSNEDGSYVVLVKVTANKAAGGNTVVFRWQLTNDGSGWRTNAVMQDIGPW